MTHEPECRSFDGGHTCICDVIRPAYKRGREDAANAVMTMKGAVKEPVQIADILAIAIAAARGDGEQA